MKVTHFVIDLHMSRSTTAQTADGCGQIK